MIRSAYRSTAWLLAIAVPLTLVSWASAAKRGEQQRDAKECVTEALQNEIYGLDQRRSDLLSLAVSHDPDFKAAHWHRGYVQINKDWVSVDDVPQRTTDSIRVTRYLKRRAEAPQTIDAQLALADWCAKNGMSGRERAHLTRVLSINPDHLQARQRLGFVRMNDEWFSRDEIAADRARTQARRAALAAWQPKVEDIKRRLNSRGTKQRELAEKELRAISDPDVIPALEIVLSGESARLGQLVVEVLGSIKGQESSQSLARHAVISQFDEVRESAAEALRDRPLDDYVPSMLAAMHTSIQSQREIVRGTRRGRLMYRHVLFRENQDDREISRFDTNYRRIALPGGSANNTLRRTFEDIGERAEDREEAVAEANRQTVSMNERIMATLDIATRTNLYNTPEQWWSWWNEHNEVYISGEKPTRETVSTEEVAIVDRTSLGTSGPSGSTGGTTGGSEALDCLAAGTLVWTDAGPKAIETIEIGDLVLSQNPETGELTYKPVLDTTVRPAGDLLSVSIGNENIETSGGHLFWVAGNGWVKSRQLKSGASIHAVNGAVPVSAVESGSNAETYNLVVAENNTYFVGESRILCHDNTIRQPTDRVVPGLAID